MGREIRYMPFPGTLYEVTCRTVQRRFLMKPSREVNEQILAVLGRACSKYPVDMYLVVFTSNHMHMILSADSCNRIADFMGHLNSNIARRVGPLHDWTEKFWSRRYKLIAILDDRSLLKKVRYLLSHGCKEGLVARPSDWPGVNCVDALVHGERLVGCWLDRENFHQVERLGKEPKEVDFTTEYEIPLTPLPCLADKTDEERKRFYRELVEEIEAETRERHAHEKTRPMGLKRVLAQDPHDRPSDPNSSPAPLCHAERQETMKWYREGYRVFLDLYRYASARLRGGDLSVVFPDNCFRPSLAFQPWSPGTPFP